jgi:phenylpropionate dioxygenase-like ring-hydroxylating dioxygenase large terminal subunit
LIDKARYTSPDVQRRELDKLFGKVWQLACLTSDVERPGDYYEYKIGDQSILIVRDEQDRIRAFFNVCQHRGRKLKDGCGAARQLRCAYHGWTWSLNGSVLEVPERDEFMPFPDEEAGLAPVQVDVWECFVFVNLDPHAPPLLEHLGELPDEVAAYKLHRQYKWSSRTKVLNVNWKAALDAFQENYHARYVHPETNSFADYHDNTITLLGDHSRQILPFGSPDALVGGDPTMDECLDSMEWTLGAFGEDTSIVEELRKHEIPDGHPLRDVLLTVTREGLTVNGIDAGDMSDTQLVDFGSHYIFPNIGLQLMSHGSWLMRFRPNGADPGSSICDMWWLHRVPDGQPLPPAVDNIEVAEGESCGAIMDQDFRMLAQLHEGMRSQGFRGLRLGAHESRIRHMHSTIDRYLQS